MDTTPLKKRHDMCNGSITCFHLNVAFQDQSFLISLYDLQSNKHWTIFLRFSFLSRS